MSSGEFDNLNDVIDGVGETNEKDSGILRQNASGTTFFLAVPLHEALILGVCFGAIFFRAGLLPGDTVTHPATSLHA